MILQKRQSDMPTSLFELVEANQKDSALVDVRVAGDFHGLALVVIRGAEAYPFAGGSGELDDLGGRIAARELQFQPRGFILIRESADLHAPASAAIDRLRRFQYFHAHLRDTGAPYVRCLRSGEREI